MTKFFRWLLAVIALTAVTNTGFTQDSLSVSKTGQLYDYWGEVQTVTVAGDHAYLGIVPGKLTIADISNPANPVIAGEIRLNSGIRCMTAAGDYIYICSEEESVVVCDISDPAFPFVVDEAYLGQNMSGIDRYNDYLFVSVVNDLVVEPGIVIIDISDPTGIELLSVVNGYQSATGLEVGGDYLYVIDYENGLSIIELTSLPFAQVGDVELGGYPVDLAVDGAFVYVSMLDNSVISVDVSDPDDPVIAGEYHSTKVIASLEAENDIIYCSNGLQGLQVIDFSDPVNAVEIGNYAAEGFAWNGFWLNDLFYLADGIGGIQVYDAGDPGSLEETGSLNNCGFIDKVAVDGETALVADQGRGIAVVDFSDPADPAELGFYDETGGIGDIVCSGDMVIYASADWSFSILDVSDPLSIELMSETVIEEAVVSVDVNGYDLYVSGGEGVKIYDISNGYSPVLITEIALAGIVDIEFFGDFGFFVSEDNRLAVYDIGDSGNPVHMSEAVGDMSQVIKGVEILGDYAFSCGDDKITIFNIANPAAVVFAGEIEGFTQLMDLQTAAEHFYVADYDFVRIFHFLSPTEYNEIGWYQTWGWASGIATSGNHVLVADAFELGIYDAGEALWIETVKGSDYPEEFTVGRAYPNPFNQRVALDFMLPAAANIRLAVYDITGREVDRLFEGYCREGMKSLTWSPKGNSSGVYFVSLQQGSRTVTRKVNYLK